MAKFLVLCLLLPLIGVNCKKYLEEDLLKLPKFYYMDDYERCMERKDGLYCLGQFNLYSDVQPNPLYDLIKEVSQDPNRFNRTQLNRGYCMPMRCPGGEANMTARFERCVDDTVRRGSLRARLRTLHYCRARGEQLPRPDTNDTPHKVFLYVVLAILSMNALGTVYDVKMGPVKDKNPYMMMFSIPANWNKLTDFSEANSPRLKSFSVFEGFKGFMFLGALVAHVPEVAAVTWLHNIQFLEKMLDFFGPMFGGLTTGTQYSVFIPVFITTMDVLIKADKNTLELSMIPRSFFKRVFRLLPVYLLVNGFCATWWYAIGDGPLWPIIIGQENKFCREKFWLLPFFLQHIFEPHKICNGQTWVISAIVHSYIPIMIVVYILKKWPQYSTRVLQAFIAVATACTAYVALSNLYIPNIYIINPEHMRAMFSTSRSFTNYFFSPYNCLIITATAVWLAFQHYRESKDRDQKQEKEPEPSTLMVAAHYISLPGLYAFYFVFGTSVFPYTNPIFMALLIPVERLITACFCVIVTNTYIKVKSPFTQVLNWKWLRMFARMAMSMNMVHWAVNKTLMANRPFLFYFSWSVMIQDMVNVTFFSFVVAIPLTLLVEYPFGQLVNKLL